MSKTILVIMADVPRARSGSRMTRGSQKKEKSGEQSGQLVGHRKRARKQSEKCSPGGSGTAIASTSTSRRKQPSPGKASNYTDNDHSGYDTCNSVERRPKKRATKNTRSPVPAAKKKKFKLAKNIEFVSSGTGSTSTEEYGAEASLISNVQKKKLAKDAKKKETATNKQLQNQKRMGQWRVAQRLQSVRRTKVPRPL